jgi:hypothetical protein
VEGLALLDQALSLVDKTGEHFCEAELYRLKGEQALQAGGQSWGRSGGMFPESY